MNSSDEIGDRRYFTIRLPGDDEPFCLASLDEDGIPERFVPGEGWVDMPALAGYFHGEEVGAEEVGEAVAREHIKAGLGAMSQADIEALRGNQ